MTRGTTTPLAVSADYFDALLSARRAKNCAFLLLLLFLLLQITIFFLVRFDVIPTRDRDASVSLSVERPSTGPAETTQRTAEGSVGLDDLVSYTTGVIVFAATAMAIIVTVVLLIILLTMLQGRLLGVARVTSALMWSILLLVLLLPWQRFYSGGPVAHAQRTIDSRDDFRLPGVLYTWPELRRDAHFSHDNMGRAILKYVRFVGAPIVALILLFMVQAKSGRGLKYALGEAEVPIDVGGTPA